MDIKFPVVITKYSEKSNPSRYLFVYSSEDEEDISVNHPDILDWQSGLENLKQKHVEPVKQQEKEKEDIDDSCIAIVEKVDINDASEDIEEVKKMLTDLFMFDSADFLKRFLSSRNPINLYSAIEKTRLQDPLSHYRLCKVAKKLNL